MFGLRLGQLGASSKLWSESALWPSGASSPGLWIDPSYVASCFQDSAGTTALSTVGTVLDSSNPVGLVLDRKGGLALGPEGITSVANCSGSWTCPVPTTVIRNGSTNGTAAYFPVATVLTGKTYQVSFDVADKSGDDFFVRVGNSGAVQISSNGSKSLKIVATSDLTVAFGPWGGSTGQATITNISVREIPGLHLSQSTSAARPVASARVNLLTYSEDFSNAAWQTNGNASKGSVVSDPLGGNTARTVTATSANGDIYQFCSAAIGPSFTNSVYIKRRTGTGTIQLSTPANLSTTVAVTSEWQRFSISGTSTVGGTAVSYLAIRIVTSGDAIDIAFGQLNPGSTALPYQRVGAASDYTATGFPLYTKFDGTDDALASATFSAGTLTSSMDCLIAVRRDSTANAVCGLYNAVADATKFFGMAESGSSSGCVGSGAGTPTVWVDGTQLTGGTAVTRGTLHTALTAGSWHILEMRGLDLSTWTAAGVGLYTYYVLNGAIGKIELFASGQDANRDKARARMAAYFGVTLP